MLQESCGHKMQSLLPTPVTQPIVETQDPSAPAQVLPLHQPKGKPYRPSRTWSLGSESSETSNFRNQATEAVLQLKHYLSFEVTVWFWKGLRKYAVGTEPS